MKEIKPDEIPLYPSKEDILPLRLLSASIGLEDGEIWKLINTCQWLFECVDRFSEGLDWFLAHADSELTDKFMLEECGITKEKMQSMIKNLDERLKDILKQADEKQDQ